MIDSSIYQGIKPLQIESPTNNLANMLNLQGLQQSGQLNALKMQEAQRGVEQQNSLRSILSGVQPTDKPDAIAQRLMQGGHLKEASEYQKNHRENLKNEAATAKDMADVVTKRTEWYKNQLSNVKTPQDAAGWVQAQYKDQYLSPLFSSMGSAEDSIRSIPQDPAEFDGWIQKQALNMGKFIELNKPSYHTENLGNISETTMRPGLGGAPTIVSSKPINQSPDNAAMQLTSRANNAATVGASLANAAATRDVAKATRDAANVQRDQGTEMKLADDYRAQSKEFGQATSAFKQINATLDSATTSPAATLAAATKFMKILDPGSVVRESELGMALQASGVIDRATNYINVLQRGKVLTPAQAADFKNISSQMYGAAQQVQQAIDTDYKTKAKTYNLRPEMVLQDLGQNTPSPTKANAAAFDAAKEARYQAWLKSQGGAK